jgi:hypothetical protein
MYLDLADEEDTKMAEGWKAEAESIIIFVSLFIYTLRCTFQ